jgi:hypothetical protein
VLVRDATPNVCRFFLPSILVAVGAASLDVSIGFSIDLHDTYGKKRPGVDMSNK